ncbi:FUN14 domain-containing protein 1-like [Varroa jacobsoni]|uniref:FUN14 domain-containing protein 1 n=1 Tax=Varroa destructor TaxID=109461 RepID=A0A7M7K599_VARDE|nr:FUN14 domain-containing protein 1-like [Varroa destructor]XP_022697799.1 FUN14 domain-containing protein 1-like [Varroa jacobsoni]
MKGPTVAKEVRDIAERLKIVKKKRENDWLDRALEELSNASPAKQCAIGAVVGTVNGFVCGRVGKNAALVISGSFILLQLAAHMGYVKINWRAVERDLAEAKRELSRRPQGFIRPVLGEVKDFLQENMYLGGGFIGGFVIGLVTA